MNKIVLCLLLGLITNIFSQTSIVPSGYGWESNPYQIANLGNLYWIAENSTSWDKWFIQTADINAEETRSWFGGHGWGESPIYFRGNYDGQFYSIDSLFINRPIENGIGLFYRSDPNVSRNGIKNLSLTNVNITGGDATGGLVAENHGVIENCSVTGIITGGNRVGGISGYNNTRSSNCYTNVYVSGVTDVGGFCGDWQRGTIENSYSSGTVIGVDNVGGLFGDCGYLEDEYVGYTAEVQYCYSSAQVIGSTDVGGLIGHSTQSGFTSCFWDTDSSGVTTSAGGTGKTTEEMKSISPYANGNWDFENTWSIYFNNNEGYPYLQWEGYDPVLTILTNEMVSINSTSAIGQGEIINPGSLPILNYGLCWNQTGYPTIEDPHTEHGPISELFSFNSEITGLIPTATYYVRAYVINDETVCYANNIEFTTILFDAEEPVGAGIESDPYLISSFSNLLWFCYTKGSWDKYFIQTADINASKTSLLEDGVGWKPVGDYTTKFEGIYDGQNHYIDSLYFNRPSNGYSGLFGYISGSYIGNLKLKNVNMTGQKYIGALTGYANSGTIISNCSSNGSIASSLDCVGGLVGYLDNSTINYCYSELNVLGKHNVGGLLGVGDDSEITNCYSRGSVSYYEDSVGYAGGLIGQIWGSTFVDKSYSTGWVSSGFNGSGGLISYLGYSSSCQSSFWDYITSGQSFSAAGESKSTTEMKTITTFTSADWDFTDVWNIDGVTNNGYPFLRYRQETDLDMQNYIPLKTKLYNNYPNPFNPETTIKYSLINNAQVNLKVFDIAGREVCSLVDQKQNKGSHEVKFDGSMLTSGIYFYRLSIDGKAVENRKMMLLK